MRILPVIMCGGYGERMWPDSRKNLPKQFLNLIHKNYSLLQQALLRASKISAEIVLIGNEDHRFLILENIRQLNLDNKINLLLEQCCRNTLTPTVLSCLLAIKKGFDYTLVMPSDHFMEDNFIDLIRQMPLSDNGLFTFAIKPREPSTEYGYIEFGEKMTDPIWKVKRFIEKPNIEIANDFLKKGNFYWNSGIFLLHAENFLNEVLKYEPELLKNAKTTLSNKIQYRDYDVLRKDDLLSCKNISIDYGIMEKSEHIKTIRCDNLQWNDLGSWNTLHKLMNNENHNTIIGDNIVCNQTVNTLINNQSRDISIVCHNIGNLIISMTDDAILIAKNDDTLNVFLKNFLKSNIGKKLQDHKFDYRPWGKYENILEGSNFKVKRITVLPQKAISLQLHHKRSEHWIITSGNGEVILNDKIIKIGTNESVYIPKESKHRIKNTSSNENLVFIEVQCGDYFGEDDILRFNDEWGRK